MAIGVDKDEMLEYINKYNLVDSFNIYDITLIYLKQEDDEDGSANEHYEVECRIEWTDPQSPKFRGALRKCLVDVEEYKSYIKRKHSVKWL
jgi:hypothetical protein